MLNIWKILMCLIILYLKEFLRKQIGKNIS